MRPLPVRTSLTLLYAGLVALIATSVAVGYHRLLVRQVDRDATTDLEEFVRGLHAYIRFTGGVPALVYDERDPDEAAFVQDATRYYQIYDAGSGALVAQSRGLAAAGLQYTPAEVIAFAQRRGTFDLDTDQGRLRLSSSLLGPDASGRRYLLQVALSLDRMDRSIAALERTMLWSIALGLAAAALVGWGMARWALAPLSRLAEATHHVSIENLRYRLPVRGAGDELDEVSIAFNLALDRVERSVDEMRQFSAALAHELRTPLAILRGETELALRTPESIDATRERLEGQIEEIDRLNGLITQLLTLARAEAGQIAVHRAPTDLAGLSRATVEQIEPVAEAKGIALTCEAPPQTTVSGDEAWLERLLLILLDNAIKFTPAGGRIEVLLDEHRGHVELSVTDSGPGIAAEALPHVFERFYRADASRSRRSEGAGLGLALAKWIAQQHQATLVASNAPGGGSRFVARFAAYSATVADAGQGPGDQARGETT